MSKKVLVVGENCLDSFVYCECNRLSPEVEVPVVVPKNETRNYGMAGNVYENIRGLAPDYQVEFFRPAQLIEKIRYCSAVSGHNFLRVDKNDRVEELTKDKFTFELKNHGYDIQDFDAVAISSYNKGFLSAETIGWIANQHPLTFVDCKFVVGDWSKNVFVLKINKKEYEYNCQNVHEKIPSELVQNLIVTLGKNGIWWVNNDTVYGQKEVKVANLSGAGDTVLATLVVSYLKNNDLGQAIKDANVAAGVAVSNRGVYAVKDFEVWPTENDGINITQ